MVLRSLVFLVLMGVLAVEASAAPSCEKLIATGNPDYPPYLWRDPANTRKLIGADADLLKQIGEQIGVKIEVIYAGTQAEAEEDVRAGRADLLLATRKNLPQLEQMDYVHPAMHRTYTRVWMQKARSFPYAGWDDLLGRSGETTPATALSPEFDSFARQSLMLQPAQGLAKAFQKLLLGRIDYVLAEGYPGQLVAAQLGISEQLDASGPAVSGTQLYLALSHNSACNDVELRGQLARKMTELVDSAAPEALLKSNVQRWQAQQVPVEAILKD
ncbi:amino acid ABC transporter substrate-binding protein, PAAT family [Pseudomonas pohangensis]|uniref:Amino acid ABC transporter substrate-binding protein, PAAT family n=1 Tax=Pseudomonas pohangensis TaxID=364197 RepID=A0A1H2GCK2_9PSED|nr:transporter substrate-binding domain-containing protein [Pseudomonas pohangensis]SDU17118.1 amino acid ABC transporter substrate-binding protein, PAAT family [Pseudomonas pohangensis]